MPDLLLKDIDDATFDRLSAVANERGCRLEEVGLHALRYALGLSAEDLIVRDRQDIATLRGIWNQGENQVFHEAIEAFKQVDSGPSFEPGPARRKS